ncbi:MAG TPA: hypothetical protein VGM20_04365 [Gemmatimonadales bacterium]|jgi:hypothetical protein
MSLFGVEVVSDIAGGMTAYRERLSGAQDAGVKAMASMYRNAVRKEFKYEGSGKQYPSRKARTIRDLTVQAVALGGQIRDAQQHGGSRKFIASRKQRLSGVTLKLQRVIKRKGVDAGALHRASVVGASPSQDVGTIVQGIQAGITDGERRVGDVGGWKGWAALHDGGGRLTGPRPYLINALNKVRGKLAGVNVTVVRKSLGFNG